MAHINLSYHTVVLVTPVDVCAYSAIVDEVDEPVMGFLCKRLSLSTPVRKFRRVYSSDAYVKLRV